MADVITALAEAADVGVNLLELDALAHRMIRWVADSAYSLVVGTARPGVGRTMQGDPHIPHDGRPGRGYPLRPGLVMGSARCIRRSGRSDSGAVAQPASVKPARR